MPDVLGFLAIGAFAGLRMAEIEVLTRNDIELDGGFVMSAQRRRRVRVGVQ